VLLRYPLSNRTVHETAHTHIHTMASSDVANGSPVPPASNNADLPPVPGKVETAVLGKDDPVPDNLERVENKDVLSRHKGNADFVHPEEEEEEAPPPDDDDLFGDGDDDEMREEAEELGEPYVNRTRRGLTNILIDTVGKGNN